MGFFCRFSCGENTHGLAHWALASSRGRRNWLACEWRPATCFVGTPTKARHKLHPVLRWSFRLAKRIA